MNLGIDQEDRVLMILNDTPAFPVTFFAAMRIGAVPIPTNTLLGADDYRFFVENSRAKAIGYYFENDALGTVSGVLARIAAIPIFYLSYEEAAQEGPKAPKTTS